MSWKLITILSELKFISTIPESDIEGSIFLTYTYIGLFFPDMVHLWDFLR